MSNATHEDTLLNALLISDFETGVEEAQAAGLGPEDFLTDWNRKLWKAMVAVRGRGSPLELFTVHQQLEADGMKAADATTVIAEALNGAPLPGRIPWRVEKVKAEAHQRQVAKSIELANSRIAEGEDPLWTRTEMNEQMLRIDAEAEPEAKDQALATVGPQALRALSDRLNGDESRRGLRTGLRDLDDTTSGINPGELWIVGGMPGRGKTAFALQVAVDVAGDGVPVYLVSLEMSAGAIFRRLLKMKFGSAAESPSLTEWRKVCDYADDLKTLPLIINDSASLEAHEIQSRARLAIERHGIRLIIVDYLQLIRMPKSMERREAVGEACNALRQLAKETGVPVILTSQLRRPSNINERPTMIDLKESGDIEAHAHVVLLMYFPVGTDGSFTHEEEIVIGKQREGPVGRVEVYFEGPRGKFHARERGV